MNRALCFAGLFITGLHGPGSLVAQQVNRVALVTARLDSSFASSENIPLTWLRFLAIGPGSRFAFADRSGEVMGAGLLGGDASLIGGRGQGPGEVSAPYSGGWVGDSLWVHDTGLRRITIWPLTGRPVSRGYDAICGGTPFVLLADRTCIVTRLSEGGLSVNADPELTLLERRKFDGTFLHNEYTLSVHHQTALFVNPNSTLRLNQPFGDSPLYAFGTDGNAFVVVERPAPTSERDGSFSIIRWSSGQTNTDTIRVSYKPVVLTAHVRDSALTAVQQGARKNLRADVPMDSLRRRMFLPEFLTPVAGVKVANAGVIWLRPNQASFGPGRASQNVWVRFSRSGEIEGAVAFPTNFRLLDIRGRFALGELIDSVDVPTIAKFSF